MPLFRMIFPTLVMLGTFFIVDAANAQNFHTNFFQIEQYAASDGGVSYRLVVSMSPVPILPFDGGSMIAPDGTEFHTLAGFASRDTFAEMSSLVFGDWTFIERPVGKPPLSYKIRVQPFELNEVISETPVILSPSD